MSDPQYIYGGEHFGLHFGLHLARVLGPSADGRVRGTLGVDNVLFGGEAYPFTQASELSFWLEDLHISTHRQLTLPLRLNWISLDIEEGQLDVGVPPAVNPADLQFATNALDIIDTREMEHAVRVWDPALEVHVWKDEDTVIQAVLRTDVEQRGRLGNRDYIDPRAISYRPQLLQDVRVKVGDNVVSALRSDKTLRVKAGYNMQLGSSSQIDARGERFSQLDIDAVPGAGLGRFPGCDVNTGIVSLGGAQPTVEGNLLLGGDNCITVRPKVTFESNVATVYPGEFDISDACTAACECGDFVSVVNYATQVWNRYRVLAARAQSLQVGYHDLRAELVAWRECAQSNPLRVHTWKAQPCAVGIGVGVCNVDPSCLSGATLTVKVKDSGGNDIGGSVAEGDAFQVEYTGGLGYNVPAGFSLADGTYSFQLPDVEPGRMGFVFLRYELSDCEQAGEIEVALEGDLGEKWGAVGPLTKAFNLA